MAASEDVRRAPCMRPWCPLALVTLADLIWALVDTASTVARLAALCATPGASLRRARVYMCEKPCSYRFIQGTHKGRHTSLQRTPCIQVFLHTHMYTSSIRGGSDHLVIRRQRAEWCGAPAWRITATCLQIDNMHMHACPLQQQQ